LAPATDAEDEEDVDDAVDCKDDDCEYAIFKGCVPTADAGNVQCTYQYRFGDMLPSTSCRCAGAGIFTAKYGSLEDAFAALSEGNAKGISLEQFTDLMTNYNVKGYTAAWEFQKANTSGDGSLSKDEFVLAAEDLMSATTGGNKSLGSSGSRCCCPKQVQQPDEICLRQERGKLDFTMDAFTISLPTVDSSNQLYDHMPGYNSSVYVQHSGSKCYGSCHYSGEERRYIGKIHSGAGDGKAMLFDSGAQAGGKKYVKYGDGLYLQAQQQTYRKCIRNRCTHHRSTYVTQCGSGEHRHMCTRTSCSSNEYCEQYQTLSFCGHMNHNTGLARYVKVGTVGSCVPEDQLRTKMFVGHKTCPSGHYHRTRDTGLFADASLQVCDCADKCP